MNRRDFVGRVVLGGAAAACTNLSESALAAPPSGQLDIRFIGMMGFIERRDQSFLVATPGDTHHHLAHVPFLMARAGSKIARALDMRPVPGVIPAAFDTQLENSLPGEFVYRSLVNTSIEVISGGAEAVVNHATQMAHLGSIAPGKRVRGNIERWASSTVSLRGGRIENSSAHPDAGKLWSFGSYRQRLTDAVSFHNTAGASATLRLTSGADAVTVAVASGEAAELWVISSADQADRVNNPNKLIHSELAFDYLVGAKAVVAECAEATGREVPPTRLPFTRPTTASAGLVGREAGMPPLTEFCFIADMLLGSDVS
jgi:hypothetical protein